MATTNPFDLLGDDDNDDLSVLIASAAVIKKSSDPATAASAAPPAKPAKLPTKPPPPAQAVRDAKTEASRGGGHGRGRGNGQGRGGGGGFNRNSIGGDNTVGSDNGFPLSYKYSEDRESGRPSERRGGYGSPRGGFRGGRRGGFSDGHSGEGERPRRVYERRSGTGRGDEIKRDGAGRGNWGTATDEIPQETEEPAGETDAAVAAEEKVVEEENVEAEKENPVNEPEEKEPEEKQMTLEEYVKVLEEKRKALLVLKTEERKVDVDKEFESMHLVSKKGDDAIFIKLGSEKDKRKDAAEKEERAKKAVSINEFLKPAAGETYYRAGGRGRGRGGRGSREGFGGSNGTNNASAPSIEDPGQFPSLGGAK
ncbi:hypothetical protein Nepgr_011417 [Nepenthes gracilis]|uniref:Hyaluronan/mRNA-binding protein domain-containing protein n=1 Tax=Nepenthes gracilis TaxID=150966 RepID=A0AAD3SF43_NEPGR|nr:hypothetical protein Nepgr_011417 [Nepenthes gracilis]